ncbi:MAG: hypothetical protein R3E58_11560 [Phycisphaerae bacterium]
MNQQLIQNLVCIPRLLKTKEDSTMVSLVKESGYKSKQSESLRDELREYIECHPEFIEDWLAFSEDQRSSPAWFFTYERNGQYQLGWFATDCGISKQELFDSGAPACAEFITLFANIIE